VKVSTAFSLKNGDRPAQEGLLLSWREESQQLQGREQKDRDAKEKKREGIYCTSNFKASKHTRRHSFPSGVQEKGWADKRHCWGPAVPSKHPSPTAGAQQSWLMQQETVQTHQASRPGACPGSKRAACHCVRDTAERGWPGTLQVTGGGGQARPRDRLEGALGFWHRNAHHGLPRPVPLSSTSARRNHCNTHNRDRAVQLSGKFICRI